MTLKLTILGCGTSGGVQELTFLSLKGQVRRIDGQTYARRAAAAP